MSKTIIENQTFDEERSLYGTVGAEVTGCRFEGTADGESPLKESRDITVKDSFFDLRYPFWHDENLSIDKCEMTGNCRAALWYTNNAVISDSKLHGIKALRECGNIRIENCDVISPEFGWFNRDVDMKHTAVEGEYFMMRSEKLEFEDVSLKGKYSFQYITDSVFENCNFDTKDAFWHAKNVTVRNSKVKGEYLAWYCENVTFENCIISGTQPFCYCKGLKLINCEMHEADLSFEKSDVDADITTPLISIKNPKSGVINVPKIPELIMTDPEAKCEIKVRE